MTPLFVRHRVNTVVELGKVHPDHGVEIDLRSHSSSPASLHLSHDPWQVGEDFSAWLKVYASRGHRGPLILNTKEDLLEDQVLQCLAEHRVTQFFFLDTALPTLVRRCLRQGERHFAIRYSQFEGHEFVAPFIDKADWVWVDCFDAVPVALESVEKLAGNFKVCLVSPELHHASLDKIRAFLPLARFADAICTKEPSRWS